MPRRIIRARRGGQTVKVRTDLCDGHEFILLSDLIKARDKIKMCADDGFQVGDSGPAIAVIDPVTGETIGSLNWL